MKCRFCSDRAFDTCLEPVTQPAIAFPRDLRAGDLVESTRTLEFKIVRSIIVPPQSAGCPEYQPEYTLLDFSWPRPVIVTVGERRRREVLLLTPTMPIRILKTEPCDTPVCECHAIDRGDGRPICPDHWDVRIERQEPAADETPGKTLTALIERTQ